MNYPQLAEKALAHALLLRKKYNSPLSDAIDAINLAEQMGIEVRLTDIPSMEGIYSPGDKPRIFLSSLRPSGRRNFTCAHEIGHHVFGHGEQFDEIRSESTRNRAKDPEEFLADCFAGYLLMPKTTVQSGAINRNINLRNPSAIEIYSLANWLNVGYSTLIQHMCYSLNILNDELGISLLKQEPKKIRSEIYAESAGSGLHVYDEFWAGRAIDCEVGDFIKTPKTALIEGRNTVIHNENNERLILRAIEPGIGKISYLQHSAYIRVSKHRYTGLSLYRHEEEFYD